MKITEALISTNSQHDHVLHLISEIIFLEKKSHSRKYGKKKKIQQPCGLSSIQQFQLAVVLCEFYERPGQEMVRNAMFLSLFEGSNASRLKFLHKLIATAIAGSIASILVSAGTLIQQLGYGISFIVNFPVFLFCNASMSFLQSNQHYMLGIDEEIDRRFYCIW